MDEEYQGITVKLDPSSRRAAAFQHIFGRLTGIPVVYATPASGLDAETRQPVQLYQINMARITHGELLKLTLYYADLLNTIPDEAKKMIEREGVSILVGDDITLED
jgi:hypothetical protein